MVPSNPPVASARPSGAKARVRTPPCVRRLGRTSSVDKSQKVTAPFKSAAASVVPSGLIASATTEPEGPAKRPMEVAGGQVPDPHNGAYVVTERQKAAIGRYRQGAERLRRARDRESLAACRQVPDSCRVIAAGGGERGPVA